MMSDAPRTLPEYFAQLPKDWREPIAAILAQMRPLTLAEKEEFAAMLRPSAHIPGGPRRKNG